jgi:aspartyl-tRNA synthetase
VRAAGRPDEPNMETGAIELVAQHVRVLNAAKTPPF